MSIRIGMASYGLFSKFIEEIETTLPQDVELVVLNDLFSELETSIRKLEATGNVDVFVGSGGNADFLEKYLKNIPLVRVKVTGFDLLNALKEVKPMGNHAAVITRSQSFPELEAVRELLNIQIEMATYEKEENLDLLLQSLSAQGIRDIIGSAYVLERAARYGLRGHFIYSVNGVREAVYTAISLTRNIQDAAEKAKKLSCILDYSAEGIILVDRNGIITDFNISAERILQRNRTDIVGKSCKEVLPNTQLDVVMEEKRPQFNKIQDLGNVKIVTNRSPIINNGEVIGALATFFSVNNIKKAEISIRQHQFKSEYIAKHSFHHIMGQSAALVQMKQQAGQYARHDACVLITGRSGTGKELVAQSIHNASLRSKELFVTVDCSAYSAALLERELFGFEDGASTGGNRKGKQGAFELAHHGTLYLNEIGDIPMKIQTRLVRIIEEGEVIRIGRDMAIAVDVRIIASTNRNLQVMLREGTFREDLYYRLNVLPIHMPELRECIEDIPVLIRHLIAAQRKDLNDWELDQIAAAKSFIKYEWPGNVRELQNVVERFCILYQQGVNPEELASSLLAIPYAKDFTSDEEKKIREILKQAGGNREKAAELLGISRTTLWRKLKEYHIDD